MAASYQNMLILARHSNTYFDGKRPSDKMVEIVKWLTAYANPQSPEKKNCSLLLKQYLRPLADVLRLNRAHVRWISWPEAALREADVNIYCVISGYDHFEHCTPCSLIFGSVFIKLSDVRACHRASPLRRFI